MMAIEDEMKLEANKLERELSILNEELEKLHKKVLQILMVKKKKERDLRILRAGYQNEKEEKEFQTTLAKLLKGET